MMDEEPNDFGSATAFAPSNRQRHLFRQSSGRLGWCGTCDAALVGRGERCRNCRQRDSRRLLKVKGRHYG